MYLTVSVAFLMFLEERDVKTQKPPVISEKYLHI